VKFKRKDKWLKHVQDAQHQLDNFCPVQHCEREARNKRFYPFGTPKEALNHMFDEHVGRSLEVHDFSCAIGGCEHGDPPYLTKDQLAKHLVEDHRFHEGAQDVVDAVETTEPRQLNEQLVPRGIRYLPCRICSPTRRRDSLSRSPTRKRRRVETVVYCVCHSPLESTHSNSAV